MTHWHFYCDESGNFEKVERFKSILVGMLIPEEEKACLSQKYFEIKDKHKIEDSFVHATKMHKKAYFEAFKKDLIELTLASPVLLLRMQYQEDTLDESAGEISESFACNRYLYMIEALLEHMLYYRPEGYGTSSTYTINPNSRVFPCSDAQVDQMKALGFNVFKPQKAKSHLVQVWDTRGLRVFLNRLQLEYSVNAAVLGERRIAAIDLQVAEKSKDPFVHWTDIIAWQLMWRTEEENTQRLIKFLDVDAHYGVEEQTYKTLCRLFLSGRHKEFIEHYLRGAATLTSAYYQRQLAVLFTKGVNEMGGIGLADLLSLETLADEALRRSSGNWKFVSALVDKIFELADLLPEAEARQDKTQWLRFKLNNHRLSYHNHRGEVLPAWQAAEAIDALGPGLQTVAQWRTWAEYQNRRAVTHANLFSFEEGNRSLVAAMECMEQTLDRLNACSGMTLQDELLGKLRGTVAQNFAFLAPFQPDAFERAEKMFLAAKAQFDKPADRLRQNIYRVQEKIFRPLFGFYDDLAQVCAK
jgi:hypothetical protein